MTMCSAFEHFMNGNSAIEIPIIILLLMTDDRLIIEVVYAQFSFRSLGLFNGSWFHYCKGANLTLFKYPLNPLVLLVTALLDIN